MPFVQMKRGGQPGNIAINPELVTYVCSSSGPFTDIHFGEHKVAVEGSLEYVLATLTGMPGAAQPQAARSWIKTG